MAAADVPSKRMRVLDSAHEEHPGKEQVEQQQLAGAEQQEVSSGEEEAPLTETLRLGLLNMHAQEETITRKIDELSATACAFLDNLKEQFLARMDKVKEELRQFTGVQESAWYQNSLETLQAEARMVHARQLVEKLGIKVAGGQTESEDAEPGAA